MIWESYCWKKSILKSREYISRVRLSASTSERTLVRIEKEIFWGFYAARKLLDTFKVCNTTKKIRFDLITHPAIRCVDYFNWHQLHRNYDLSLRKLEIRDIRFLCNQFIHSYIFLINEAGNQIGGFFVSSDRDRNTKCYYVKRSQVLSAFRAIGVSDPNRVQVQRDESGQWTSQVERS